MSDGLATGVVDDGFQGSADAESDDSPEKTFLGLG